MLMASYARPGCVLLALGFAVSAAFAQPTDATRYDVLIAGGTVYDGSGGPPFVGDVAIHGDRIAYIGPHAPHLARERVDAHGKAVAPGFINMLAHPEASLLIDGRALSDLRQGVTLEVLGEDSMGPLTPQMKELDLQVRETSTTRSIGRRSVSTCVGSSSAASRRMSPPTSVPARCAPTCSASAMCSQPPSSSHRCARSCTRPWRRAPSA